MTPWSQLLSHLTQQIGLSLQRISTTTGIPMQRLDALKGEEQPTPQEARTLSTFLGLEVRDVLRNPTPSTPATLLFRESTTLGLDAALWRVHNAQLLGAFLLSVQRLHSLEPLETPLAGLEQHAPPRNPTYEGIYQAQRVRSALGLSPIAPIPSMLALMEDLGVAVFAHNDADDPLEGLNAACVRQPRPAILLNQPQRMDPAQLRVTLAHELAHLLLDNHAPNTLLISPDNKAHYGGLEDVEQRANAFAVNLLVPDDGVREALRRMSPSDQLGQAGIRSVAQTFGTSNTVAQHRIAQVLFQNSESAQGRLTAAFRTIPPYERGLPQRFHIDTFPDASCGLPGGPLLAAVLRQRQKGKLSATQARALLNLRIIDWLPEGEALSDAQRRPLVSEEEVARRQLLCQLAQEDPERGFDLHNATPTSEGTWRFEIFAHPHEAPGDATPYGTRSITIAI